LKDKDEGMIVKLLEKESELNEAFKAKLDKQEKDV
jgi:hypothetical protein